jgi:hypothetical protein
MTNGRCCTQKCTWSDGTSVCSASTYRGPVRMVHGSHSNTVMASSGTTMFGTAYPKTMPTANRRLSMHVSVFLAADRGRMDRQGTPGRARQVVWLSVCGENCKKAAKSCANTTLSWPRLALGHILTSLYRHRLHCHSSQQFLHPSHCLLPASISNNVSLHALENSSAVRKCVHLVWYSSKVLPSIHCTARPIGNPCFCHVLLWIACWS